MRKRKRSEATRQRDQQLLGAIGEIKADHPCWGYRRVWAYLRYRQGMMVAKNRVHRILRENHLLAASARKLRASRVPSRNKPRTNRPNEVWGIDMTKVMVQSWGWVYLVVVKDWGSKKIVGWDLSPSSTTGDWLKALSNAVNTQFPNGREGEMTLKLVSDNGCQPASMKFMAACNVLGLQQVFTSYNNPKGNADTERVFRTMKEDLIWIHEWLSFQQLKNALANWIKSYNEDFPHSALNYRTPQQHESLCLEHHQPLKNFTLP